MNIENIIVDKKEIGTLIGTAKRKWTATKKQVTKMDEISKPEGALFVNDVDLARMVKAQKILDEQIESHIDNVLIDSRGYDAAELHENKNKAVLNLLTNCHAELIKLGNPQDEYQRGLFENLGNYIEDLREKGAE